MKKVFAFLLVILFLSGCDKATLNSNEDYDEENFNKIYESEDGKKVFSELSDLKITLGESETLSLHDALTLNKITIEDIISMVNYKKTANDGGSEVYTYDKTDDDLFNIDFVFVKCHTLNGNKDIIIGKTEEIIKKCEN